MQAKATAVARLFAAIAPRYDLMNRLMSAGLDRGWRRRACALLGPLAGPGPILDVGAGTGDLSLTLAQGYPGRRVIALDFSPQMLAIAARKVAARGLAGGVALLRGDALALPCPDASCAAVAAAFTLRNVADLRQALGEMRRVVAPGGPVLCLELSRPNLPGFSPLFRLYFSRLVPVLGALIAGQRAAYTYLPASVDAFLSPQALAAAMAEAGLEQVGVTRLALGAATIHVGWRPPA